MYLSYIFLIVTCILFALFLYFIYFYNHFILFNFIMDTHMYIFRM